MDVVFDGSLRVHYGQAYVLAGGEWDGDVSACFRGQANGILGAARPGFLFLVTGLHTGHVGLEVRVAEAAPPLEDGWEECVEASLPVLDRPVRLIDWDGFPVCEMPLAAGEYRVRYCARGMDTERGATPPEAGDPIEAYQLTFWPGPPEPDHVLRQTSRTAAYWHEARQPSAPSAEDPVAERVRQVRGPGRAGLLHLDPGLVDEIARADPAVQRAVARWAAHRACEVARLADVAWVAPALDALDRGRDLPPPFDTSSGPFHALERDARVPRTLVAPPAGGPPSVPQQSAALPAILHAVQEDSLSAALNALFSAVLAFGSDRSILLDEVRQAFPFGPAH